MKFKATSSAEMFLRAAAKIVERMPHGAQGKIAKAMGVRDGYLSDLLKGKRNWSDRLRDKFAHAVGMSVVEIYGIGDDLNKTGAFFPYKSQVQDTPPHSSERAARIVMLAMKEIKLHLEVMASPRVAETINSEAFQEYRAGRFSDGDYYQYICGVFQKALEHYTLKK